MAEPRRRISSDVPEWHKKDMQKVVGILCLDYNYTPVPGDADHDSTFNFTVHRRVVPGLTFEMAQRGEMNSVLEAALKVAIAELEALPNIVGISGNCGFMMHYQELIRGLAQVFEPKWSAFRP